MRVSIVIPTYYRAKDLSALLDSILKQIVKPLEVIIVDDTPSDDIRAVYEVKKELFRKNGIEILYIRNPRKRSSAIARNIGVSVARGEIILFLDSDTIIAPDYIENILQVFQRFSNALGVQGHILIKDVPKTIVDRIRFIVINNIKKMFKLPHLSVNSCNLFEYPLFLTNVINCQWLSGSNMAFRREVFDEFKFDENLLKYAYMEDLLFTYSLYRKYPQSLYITPYAKIIHKRSEERRLKAPIEHPHVRICRKYVLSKLFGVKGLLIFALQTLGLVVLFALSILASLKMKNIIYESSEYIGDEYNAC